MAHKLTCFSELTGLTTGAIDRSAAVIKGVRVITLGEAKGHGFNIDAKSIEQVHQLASKSPNGVLVMFRHGDEGEHQDIIGESAGMLRNFSIGSDCARADFHLFPSLPQTVKERIYELAEFAPDKFGLSTVGAIDLAEIDGKKFARFGSLESVDFAKRPAANPGLLSEKCEFCGKHDCSSDHDSTELSAEYEKGDAARKLSVDNYAKKHNKQFSKKTCMSEPTTTELDAKIVALTALITGLTSKLEAKPAPNAETLTFTGDDGKVVSLSAKEVITQLASNQKMVRENELAAERISKTIVLETMKREGRVPMNPTSKVAYTLAELEALPVDNLKMLAVNSPVVPLAAKAVYRGENDKPAIDPALKGADRIRADIEATLGRTSQQITRSLSVKH
jgi:hypothetical protein